MKRTQKKSARRFRIKMGVRKKINGTKEKPRLSVFRSNSEIYAQLIDDIKGETLCATSSLTIKSELQGVNKSESAKKVGLDLAVKAKTIGIGSVVFDRNGYLYHGRVKALADGAREGGLIF
jgi:large subunit ribosomal protein L18